MYAALLGFVLGLLARVKNQPHGQPNRTAPAQESPSSQAGPIVITYTPPPLTDEEIAQKKEVERRDKTKFRIEKWGLFVLAIYSAFTGFIAWETKEATKATKIAANAATSAASATQQQLEMSERPWIKIVDAQPRGNDQNAGALSFSKMRDINGIKAIATIHFRLTVTNIGHSVADVSAVAEFFMPQFSSSEYWNRVAAEEQRFCGSPDIKAVSPQKVVIFPDEPQPFEWSIGLNGLIREQNINHLPEGTGIFPALIVCVNYRQRGLPSVYQTRAVYEISRADTHSRIFNFGKCNIQPFKDAPEVTFCEGGVPAKLLKFDRESLGDDAY